MSAGFTVSGSLSKLSTHWGRLAITCVPVSELQHQRKYAHLHTFTYASELCSALNNSLASTAVQVSELQHPREYAHLRTLTFASELCSALNKRFRPASVVTKPVSLIWRLSVLIVKEIDNS